MLAIHEILQRTPADCSTFPLAFKHSLHDCTGLSLYWDDSIYHTGPVYMRIDSYTKVEGSQPVGYILLGDVTNGKSALTSSVVQELGSFAAVYFRPQQVDATQPAEPWTTVAATALQQPTAVSMVARRKSMKEFLVQVCLLIFFFVSNRMS